MDAEIVLGLICLFIFVLMMLGLGASIKDIILFFLATMILWPLVLLTIPIWGGLWLIGKMLDIDSLVEIGEFCSGILFSGKPGEQPPL